MNNSNLSHSLQDYRATTTVKSLTSSEVLDANPPQSTLPALFISHGAPTLALEKTPRPMRLPAPDKIFPSPKPLLSCQRTG